jgi:Zn-finger nucleic acid-binding protein
MSERQGIEIDYCPKCRGVWLDKGELDKLIEKSVSQGLTPPDNRNGHYPGDRDEYRHRKDVNPYYKKKKGFLGDFFDFD